MEITLNFNNTLGKIKPMNAVNNGPLEPSARQTRSNFESYKALKIPYARNHDAAFWGAYGAEHKVDVCAIFPDFNKDPYDPASYDFDMTDTYVQATELAGTKTFYRLGSKIEHHKKKYGTLPPPDFKKWAIICEHIIRHYTEGWANGFHYDMQYWEIWNEPDLDPDDAENKRNWGGTLEQFVELFVISLKHLKECFPHLKIGGPGLAGVVKTKEFPDMLLSAVAKEKLPLDFLSWHGYSKAVAPVVNRANRFRTLLDSYGFAETESILNEWNYVADWGDGFVDSIKDLISIKGAAFVAAVMSACQDAPVDMLMYYDARPSAFNGLFDFYTYAPLKPYYAFQCFSKLADLGIQAEANVEGEDVYVTAAVNDEGKAAAMITYYTFDGTENKTIRLEAKNLKNKKFSCLLLDGSHNAELISKIDLSQGPVEITMAPNTVVFLEQ